MEYNSDSPEDTARPGRLDGDEWPGRRPVVLTREMQPPAGDLEVIFYECAEAASPAAYLAIQKDSVVDARAWR